MSVLILPAPAVAQPSPGPAVDQYVESVPTAKGNTRASTGRHHKRGKLPAELRDRLRRQGGSDAEDLEAIATAPGLGAPDATADAGGRVARGGGEGAAGAEGPDRKSAISATADAAFAGGSGRTALLLIALLATTAVVGAFAFARRRSTDF